MAKKNLLKISACSCKMLGNVGKTNTKVFTPCQPSDFGCTHILGDHVPLGLRYGNQEMNTSNVSFAFHNGLQSLQKATA